MKIKVTMKNPDALDYAIAIAIDGLGDLSLGEREEKHDELYEQLSKWFKYGEYLTVEIDTEADTATVMKGK